jgi:predicted ATP-binding protein involved in virulence
LIIGDNGSGKSTLLDAIAIGLGIIPTHLPNVGGRTFRKTDIRQVNNHLKPYSKIKLTTDFDLVWDRLYKRDKSKTTLKDISQSSPSIGTNKLLRHLDSEVIDKFNQQQDFILPVFAYYGVSRAILDVPLSRKGFINSYSRFDSMANTLNASSNFRSAFMWFYNKENEEHRLQKEQRSFDISLKELDVVRNAIRTMFPDLDNPHIAVNPLRFMIEQNKQNLGIEQLSDGYKTMLGLVIDLSSRFAMANPHLDNPLIADAIVMIDEVDLHLHPSWQQRVFGDLMRTFPNTQFIVTTHSPYIVESLNNHLKKDKIKSLIINDEQIQQLEAVDYQDVSAYLLKDYAVISTMNKKFGLIDDGLLAYFNQINILYDKMRDLEWEQRQQHGNN